MNNICDSCQNAENLDLCGKCLTITGASTPTNYVAIQNDNVNHPSHYTQGGIECIDALAAATEGLQGIEAVCTANAIKYMWRWKYKNGIEDIDKAIWYLTHLKDYLGKTN